MSAAGKSTFSDLAYAVGSGAFRDMDPSRNLEWLGAFVVLSGAKEHPTLRHILDASMSVEAAIDALYTLVANGTLTKDGFTVADHDTRGRWN